jgi:ribonuclease HI
MLQVRATCSCGHFSRYCEARLAGTHGTDSHRLCKGSYHPSSLALTVRRNTNLMPKVGFYAVRVGKRPGIYTTWSHFTSFIFGAPLLTVVIREDCREQVNGYPCATYKKMRTIEEAEAWMGRGASQSSLVDQGGVPYPIMPKIHPANHSLDQASDVIVSQSSGHVRHSSSSSTGKPTPTVQPYSKLQPASGPSIAGSRVVAGSSGATSALPMSAASEDVVYTDGACSRNGQYGSVAGIGVWWGRNDSRYVPLSAAVLSLMPGLGCRNLSERCSGRQTNNRAELIVRLVLQHWVGFCSNAWVV